MVEIDIATSTLTLPPGLRLDFGGLAKGAFVDQLADEFVNGRVDTSMPVAT